MPRKIFTVSRMGVFDLKGRDTDLLLGIWKVFIHDTRVSVCISVLSETMRNLVSSLWSTWGILSFVC